MAPRSKHDSVVENLQKFKASLVNVSGRGLGYIDKDGIYKNIAKVSIKCIAPIALKEQNLVGNCHFSLFIVTAQQQNNHNCSRVETK